MDLLEYQARELFESYGVPVLPGVVAASAAEARDAFVQLGADVAVVKAQVRAGGRGKAGGVKLVRSAEAAGTAASEILDLVIKDLPVDAVMLSPGAEIVDEYYFSILLDRSLGSYLAMCSVEGGIDIETLAVERPEALVKLPLDVNEGITPQVALNIVALAGFAESDQESVAAVLVKLWTVLRESDATMVEVNPLVKTKSGEILALDGKVTLDDNAEFRHDSWGSYHETSGAVDLERQAKELDLNYVKLDGNVGIIGNGAGLVMSTLDVVDRAGKELPGHPRPANFLDIGGGASSTVMANSLRIIMCDPQVKAVLVNVFGGITACNDVAQGIVAALDMLGTEATLPIVVRLDGNSVEVGKAILREANHPLIRVETTMDGAAAAAVRLASERG